MSVTTKARLRLNFLLRPFNLRLETLTAQMIDAARINRLNVRGYFAEPSFPLLPGMVEFDIEQINHLGRQYSAKLKVLMSGSGTEGYSPSNAFFDAPDAEILYLMVRSLQPKRILEIGSGNSTKICKQAISDGDIKTEHIAIDPAPRTDITETVKKLILQRLEDVEIEKLVYSLGRDDILFIDSSHEVRVANDVAKLFCNVLPLLPQGVVVHVHDIFLPFDYPYDFAKNFTGWGEQYLLQLYLQSRKHEILWPGFYVQNLRKKDYERLDFLGTGRAQSFWFRVV